MPWRLKNREGADLMPLPDHHFLCARQPGFAAWWQGFLKDILDRYPDLDGMDFAEPAAVWKGKLACQCDICRKEIGAGLLRAMLRQLGLTPRDLE